MNSVGKKGIHESIEPITRPESPKRSRTLLIPQDSKHIIFPGSVRQSRSLNFPLRRSENPIILDDSEHPLPPVGKSRRPGFRDESPWRHPRSCKDRSSWSTTDSDDITDPGPFASPFDDDRIEFLEFPDESVGGPNSITILAGYNILLGPGLLLFPEDVEVDDWLHDPDPYETEPRDYEVFHSRTLLDLGGFVLVMIGLIGLFVISPAASLT